MPEGGFVDPDAPKGSSTMPTAKVTKPTAPTPLVGGGSDLVRVERVKWGKGGIAERRKAFGVPEGTLGCFIWPDGTTRTFDIYEHSLDEQRIKYKALFMSYPDIQVRDRLIWLNVGGTKIDKTLTVTAVVYDSSKVTALWVVHCEEHTN